MGSALISAACLYTSLSHFFTEILMLNFWTDVLVNTIQAVSTSRNQWTPTDDFTNVLSTESGDFLRFDFRYTVHWTILPVDICIDSYWTICAAYYCINLLPSSCDLFLYGKELLYGLRNKVINNKCYSLNPSVYKQLNELEILKKTRTEGCRAESDTPTDYKQNKTNKQTNTNNKKIKIKHKQIYCNTEYCTFFCTRSPYKR